MHRKGQQLILGHSAALDTLRAVLRGGRAPHAWIFHGPFGVGKTTVAMEFARLRLDAEVTEDHITRFHAPRDTEDSALIDAGTHPDLTLIRRELAAFSIDRELRSRTVRNIPVDLLREHLLGGTVGDKHVDARIGQAAARGRGRLFIIDEAELLEPVAQNALLKTLEEPPQGACLILCTTRPDMLLPTIHSRCQGLAFAPLESALMAGWIASALPKLDAGARDWLHEFADGAPGRALFAARHELSAWTTNIEALLDRVAAGSAPREAAETLETHVDALAESLLKDRRDALAALRPPGADEADDATESEDDEPETTGAARGGGAFKESKVNVKRESLGWLVGVMSSAINRRLRAAATDGTDDPERWASMLDLLTETESIVHSNVQPKWALADFVARAAVLPAGAPR